VPASMKLLGNRNWYLPPWLEWLPHLGVEGPAARIVEPRPERTAGDGGPGDRPGNGAPVEVPVAARSSEDRG